MLMNENSDVQNDATFLLLFLPGKGHLSAAGFWGELPGNIPGCCTPSQHPHMEWGAHSEYQGPAKGQVHVRDSVGH